MAIAFRDAGRRVRIAAEPGVPEAWARDLWRTAMAAAPLVFLTVPLPQGAGPGEAFVKVYHRRPRHNWLRRLGPSRAAREGAGYAAFSARGLRTATLILWGEARRWGLVESSLIATVKLPVPTVAQAYTEAADASLLESALDELAAVHRAGLAHGDPRARNFLATRPRATVFDLGSWRRLTRERAVADLVRFLGSAVKLDGGLGLARALAARYNVALRALPAPEEDLLALAGKDAAALKRP